MAGLLLSCLFSLGASSCHAWTDDHSAHSPFCSAEQMRSPVPDAPTDTKYVVLSKNTVPFHLPIAIVVASLISIIYLAQTPSRLFAKQVQIHLTRYGPYQKMFLPYLTATHGM